jgi:hypothetical protein
LAGHVILVHHHLLLGLSLLGLRLGLSLLMNMLLHNNLVLCPSFQQLLKLHLNFLLVDFLRLVSDIATQQVLCLRTLFCDLSKMSFSKRIPSSIIRCKFGEPAWF